MLASSLARSLHHQAFAWLLGGQTLSRVGDHLYEVALAWWVLQETGSAVAMGSVLVLSFAPTILFGLLGGVVVDRYPRVWVLLLCDVLRGVLVAAMALMAFQDTLQLWHIYAAALLYGVVDSFFQPAFTALVPDLVPPADLPSANSLSSMSLQFGRIVGPALAGVILALGDFALGFTLNALSFFVAAVCLIPLRGVKSTLTQVDGEQASSASIFQDIREGIRFVVTIPFLWISFLVFPVVTVALSGPYGVSLPFLVEDKLAGDVNLLGLLYALFAAGFVLGGLWLGRQAIIRRRGILMYTSGVVAGLGMLLLGLPLPLVGLAFGALLTGVGLEIAGLVWMNILQEVVPGDKLGRVASIDMISSLALLPVGFAAAGWLTDTLGPEPVFILGGVVTMAATLLALAHPAIRRLD